MPSWTTDVAAGLGQHLASAGIGTWRADGVYAPGETGIVVKTMPPNPDRVIVISPYPVREAPAGSDITLALQVRCRGGQDPRDVDELADAVRDLLHGARNVILGPARCALVWRQSHAPLGADESGRWETSSNFYAQTAHPSSHASD